MKYWNKEPWYTSKHDHLKFRCSHTDRLCLGQIFCTMGGNSGIFGLHLLESICVPNLYFSPFFDKIFGCWIQHVTNQLWKEWKTISTMKNFLEKLDKNLKLSAKFWYETIKTEIWKFLTFVLWVRTKISMSVCQGILKTFFYLIENFRNSQRFRLLYGLIRVNSYRWRTPRWLPSDALLIHHP